MEQRAADRERAQRWRERQPKTELLAAAKVWCRRWRDKHPKRRLLAAAKARAKKRGIPFALTVNDIEWPTHCPVLGLELDYNKTPSGSRRRVGNVASLDRRDNSLGYVPGNVFVLSYRANTIKNNASLIEIKALLAYMTV
jgi:hypothetical protein